MTKQAVENAQEWSCIIEADTIGDAPIKLEIGPSASETAMLEKRLGLLKIYSLKAALDIRRNPGNMVIYISGTIDADIEQRCVVSLEQVHQKIHDNFEAWFADKTQAVSFTKAKRERMSLKEKGEQPVLEEQDDPEPIINGAIDLGELVTQYFSLALDPYPRSEGAAYEGKASSPRKATAGEEEEDEHFKNPFAALKEWRHKENKDEH